MKLAQGKRLSQDELNFLRLEGNKTQNMNSVTAGFTKIGKPELDVRFPIEKFFPEGDLPLEADLSSISIDIPPKYSSLILLSSGRTSAAVFSTTLNAQFNNDAGSNYRFNSVIGQNTTPLATESLAQTSIPVANFTGTSGDAGSASLAVTWFPNIRSPFWKNVVAIGGVPEYSANDDSLAGLIVGHWQNVAPILSIQLSMGSGNILAGSMFNVYGMR